MSVPGGHRPTGFVVLALAVFLLGIAWKGPSIPNGKRWLIVICALAFIIAALQILTAAKGRVSFFLGGTLLALLSSLGF
jgi:heme A synthase